MKIRLQIFSAALAGAALLGLAGCQGGGGSNVASINGEPITMEQFHKYLEAKPEVQVVLENGEVANARVSETLAYQALQDLIRQRMIVQLAKDMKLNPTDDEV